MSAFGGFARISIAALASLAAVTAARAAPMTLGPAAEPPPGLLAFCRDRPAECGADPQDVRRRVAALEAADTWSARFHAADAPRATGDTTQGVAMTAELWTLANRINRGVNHAIRSRADTEVYGVADRWATPLEDGVRAGDCEDFVLEKRRALLAAGFPAQALDVALVVTRQGEAHAVLLLNTSLGEYALDNLTPWIVPWRDAPYEWTRREVGGDMLTWAAIDRRGESAVRLASRE